MIDQTHLYAERYVDRPILSIEQITDGSINQTFRIVYMDEGEQKAFILQNVSSIFPPTINETLCTIEPLLSKAGVQVPKVIPTLVGELYIPADGGRWWRALSLLDGQVLHDHVTPAMAKSVGRLVGRFHTVLTERDLTVSDPLPHFHDTPFIMEQLKKARVATIEQRKKETLDELTDEVLERYTNFDVARLTNLPKRVIHADLKISNIMFLKDEAIALIDMDTVMMHSVAIEMGDALRSWAGISGEDDPVQVFDTAVCEAGLSGYLETATFLTDEERACIPLGISLLALELAARFITDAYEERYFALSSKYPNLYEQNRARANNQLALFSEIKKRSIE